MATKKKQAINAEIKQSKHEMYFILKNKNGKYVIGTCGCQVSQKEFDNVEEAEKYLDEKPYEIILNTTLCLIKTTFENETAKKFMQAK